MPSPKRGRPAGYVVSAESKAKTAASMKEIWSRNREYMVSSRWAGHRTLPPWGTPTRRLYDKLRRILPYESAIAAARENGR